MFRIIPEGYTRIKLNLIPKESAEQATFAGSRGPKIDLNTLEPSILGLPKGNPNPWNLPSICREGPKVQIDVH